MASFLQLRDPVQADVKNSHVLYAAAVPSSSDLVFVTDAPELLLGETRLQIDALARGIACVQYAVLVPGSLPAQKTVLLALLDGIGLRLFSIPDLLPVQGELSDELESMSKTAHTFSVDSLGSDIIGESFRIAMSCNETVFLLDINPARGKVTVLGQQSLDEKPTAVAFSEMTIVVTTSGTYHMLRISRGGGMAVAATVSRSEKPRRSAASTAVGDSGVAVMSFLGGLFTRRNLSKFSTPTFALALPDNRWLLNIDQELVVYSSFGAKLEEMENVFKSKSGMDPDTSVAEAEPSTEKSGANPDAIVKSNSISSIASLATGVSQLTMIDQSRALRTEKPPSDTVFSSPFVLSVSRKNELLVYAANGSVPGVIQQIALKEEKVTAATTEVAKIVVSVYDRVLATAYWSDGKSVAIELKDDLENLSEMQESLQELRLALALVHADQTERMIALRRLLAAEARAQDWHDAAIHHMECVVNLSMRIEGIDQIDLVAEAVELRGPRESGWAMNAVTATLWADFLFRLRRRVMRPSASDVDVLETLCKADESADRVRSLLSVRHHIPLAEGEALVTSPHCSLREEERVEGLVALYTSLSEHAKALMLLENSHLTNSFEGVRSYLLNSMRAVDDPSVFFTHLKWFAHRTQQEAQGQKKLEGLVQSVVKDAEDSADVMGALFEVLVEEAEGLISVIVDEKYPEIKGKDDGKDADGSGKDGSDESSTVSADVMACALLTGMAKADALEKADLFQTLRTLFNDRILHSPAAPYHSYTLLQALQSARNKALGLHEEQAYLLGRQGRHEAAADELAAEHGLAPDEALYRLVKMLPASDSLSAPEALVAAYLRVSSQGRAMRIEDASKVLRCAAGEMDIEKLLLDGRCSDESLTLKQMSSFIREAIVGGNARLRTAEILRALRKSEVRRMREDVLTKRRRFVLIGHDRACSLCTRRIGDSVFAAYPDGSVSHLACHMSRHS